MAIYKKDLADIELTSGTIYRSFMNRTIGEGDINANIYGVRVLNGGEPADLTDVTCAGYFIRSAGDTVVITGAVDGNEAYVVLPEACYVYEGQFSLAIKLTGGSVTGTMRIIDGVVSNTTTSAIVDPGTLVPSIEDLIDEIEAAVATIPADYSALTESLQYRYNDYMQGVVQSNGEYSRNSTAYCTTDYIPIEAVYRLVKPLNFFIVVCRFDASKTFISRTSVDETEAKTYTAAQFMSAFDVSGAAYVRINVKRMSGGEDINSTPADIYGSSYEIDVLGASENIYGRLKECERLKPDLVNNSIWCITRDWVQGNIASEGTESPSTDYCRTEKYYGLDEVVRLYKPAGYFMHVAIYDSSKTFLDRNSISANSAVNYDTETLKSLYARNSSAVYYRFCITQYDSGSTPTTPEDVINSNVQLVVYGSFEEMYKKLSEMDTETLPNYYMTGYLSGKIEDINELEDGVSENSDTFIFLTDYHWQKNAQNSPMLIKKIVEQTGITKLIFGGDAGRSAALAYKYNAAREDCEIYQKLAEAAPEFYGVVGNHEWNDYQDTTHEASKQEEVYNRAGIMNFYANRFTNQAVEMSAEGNYYFDNVREKIRYFFLQDTGQAKITNETVKWLGDRLEEIPDGYYVIVVSHYAYTGGTFDDTTMTGRGNLSVVRIAKLLGALKNHDEVTVNQYSNTGSVTGTLDFDFTGTNAVPIAIVSGHTHWDASLTVSESDYGILTIATTTDAYGYNQDPETHAADPREPGTTDEQAFDVYVIDIGNRKVYMTRIGGGDDREFTF